MYLDASFPGFDNEHLIGHFLGFQADKIYLNGLTANIRELMSKINLQEGENKLGKEAGKQLEWSGSTFPPIYFVYATSLRVHQKAEYASKAIGIGVIAEERLALVRTLLARVTKEKVLPGLGRYYNTVPYNRQFYWVIKWQNDTINKTAILRIVGITQQVMLAPIKASRQANTTASPITTKLFTEINNSGNFSSSNSTKSAADAEDRWPLIVADAAKVKEASKYVLQITKYIYSATNSQIPLGTRILVNPIQDIEGKAQTMVRARNPISGQQASAWGPVFANNNTTKGGSRMQNLPSRKMRQVRKMVKLSLDPESTSEFPDLQTTDKPDKDTMKSITSKAKSNTSSHSTVSGVTKADFLTLGKELRALVMNKVQSVNTANINLTMITLMKEEMVANTRKEANDQMQLMQKQMTMLQTMMTALLPSTKTAPTHKSDSTSPQSKSHSGGADTQVTQTTHHEHNTRSKQQEGLITTHNTMPPPLQCLT